MTKETLVISTLLSIWYGSFALAAENGSEAFRQALGHLGGNWSGVLEYRDYGTDRRVQIPHTRSISFAPDQSYVLMELTFTDPGYQVFAAEMMTLQGNSISSAYAGDGEITQTGYSLVSFEADAADWTAQLEGDGMDGGEPAQVRLLWRVSGDTLEVEKQVLPSAAEHYQFRNAVKLKRTPR